MHSGLWLDLDKPYTTRRSQTLMWSARKIPSLLLSIFLVTGHRYLMPSRVLGEFSKTMIHFSVVTGTGTVQLFLWNGSVYTLSCPIMCETWDLFRHSSITSLPLFFLLWPSGNTSLKNSFLETFTALTLFSLQLTKQRTVCIAFVKQRLWWSTQDLWCKSASVEKCKIPCSLEFRRNAIRGSFSPHS